jgi:hypothetical protein
MSTTPIALPDTLALPPPALRPWYKQSNESSLHFHYFCVYRDLPPTSRSQTDVAKVLNCARQTVADLSERYSWEDRAGEYQAYISELMFMRSLESRLEAANAHARVADKVVAHVDKSVTLYMDKGLPVPIKHVASILETGIKLARQARGETDNAPVAQTAVGVSVTFGASDNGSPRVPAWAITSKTVDGIVTSEPEPSPDPSPADSLPASAQRSRLSSIIFGAA